MALRFMPTPGCTVKPNFYHLQKLFALRRPLNQIPWTPSSSSSSILHRFCGSSIPAPIESAVTTLDDEALCGGGTSIYKGAQKDEWIITLAKFAVNNRNENQNVNLQFVRVVGASHTGASSLLYHITLEATDAKKQKIFHTVVWLQLWRNFMELLVWKPVAEALSAVGVKRVALTFADTPNSNKEAIIICKLGIYDGELLGNVI